MSDELDSKSKAVFSDKDSHYIMKKESTQQEDTTIIKTHASNISTPKHRAGKT